jgi:hypothetical protein
MPEKIKNNLGLIVNIISSFIVVGGLIYCAGMMNGKIDEHDRILIRHDASIITLQNDVKSILHGVARIEGKLDNK